MTPLEINIAICEATHVECYYQLVKTDAPESAGLLKYTGPDFAGDLNVMHELEMKLNPDSPGFDDKGDVIPSDRARYRLQLAIDTSSRGGPIHATAARRAEAYLRAIGKWTT